MKCKQIRDFYFIRQLMFVLMSALLLMQPAFASNVAKLYESTIRVDLTEAEKKQGKKGRTENQLIEEAFTHVLIKVSGRSDVSSSPAYQEMLKKAESLISQFRYDYRVVPVSAEVDTETTEPVENKEKWFWVRFNAQAINNLLKEAKISIWGKVRPETLIWYSQEVQGKRRLLSQHDAPEAYAVFKQQAEQRGISLIFPFLDLQDQSNVSATDVWGNFNDAILLASRRYQAQSTLTSRLFKERSGLWVSQWNLLMLGEVQSWEIRDENLERVLASGIDELADKLSRQFTQVERTESDSGLLVQINNVVGFRAFQEVDDYLRNLATVKSVALVQTEHDRVIYSINYLNSKNSLIQEIRLGDLLNSVERSRVDNEQDNNTGNDNSYTPVILDDLNKKDMSEREKALNALENPKKQAADGKVSTNAMPQAPVVEAVVEEKIVDELIPELEYWLTR